MIDHTGLLSQLRADHLNRQQQHHRDQIRHQVERAAGIKSDQRGEFNHAAEYLIPLVVIVCLALYAVELIL